LKNIKILLGLGITLLLTSSAQATLKLDKVTLKGNMQVKYTKLPPSVDTIKEVFTEGMFYGRVRTNMFMLNWRKDNYPAGALMDNKAMGIGGSLIYKTAPLSGISTTLGVYTSQNPSFWREDYTDVGSVKSGKDTFSRNNALSDDWGMTVLGQAYLQYDVSKTSIYLGRQLFESVFTKSNDTKMIPNTFDGATATIKDIDKTTIKIAYLHNQKLRDHTTSHDVIAFAGGSAPNIWSENDDASVNRNLTVDRIGNDNRLYIGSITNKSIKNLKLNLSYAVVPDVLSNLVLESHYTIGVGDDWKIVPGFRYMQQFDNLHANYNVANVLTKHDDYDDPTSLDTNLIALRVDFKNKAFLGRLGYSSVADKADIVAPWRGFPTGGFTRAMAQYNWQANTKAYMARVGYDFGKANMMEGFSVMMRYVIQDMDDDKPGVFADSNVLHVDIRQNIGKNLEAKFRFGYVDYDDNTYDINGAIKADLSYSEYRFELNYLF